MAVCTRAHEVVCGGMVYLSAAKVLRNVHESSFEECPLFTKISEGHGSYLLLCTTAVAEVLTFE